MDADQNKVLSYATNLPHNGSVQHINWASENLVDGNGNISITLPNENEGQPISFELVDAYFANTTDYAIVGKSSLGEIAIYTTPQGRGGTIDLAARSYTLYPLGGTKGILTEKSSTALGSAPSCSNDNSEASESSAFCEDDCNKSVIDVLAMVTPA